MRNEDPQNDHKAHQRHQPVHKISLVSYTAARERTGTCYAQRLQPLNARLRRDRARDEREDGGARLSKARHPPDGPGQEARWEDAAGVVHDDGVDGPEDDADETAIPPPMSEGTSHTTSSRLRERGELWLAS